MNLFSIINRKDTYIIDHYNPSVRIIDLISHTTYVVYANFIHKWRNQQLKVDSEQQIFLRNFSWQFYLPSEFLPNISKEIVFVFCLMSGLGLDNILSNRPRRLQPEGFFFQIKKEISENIQYFCKAFSKKKGIWRNPV